MESNTTCEGRDSWSDHVSQKALLTSIYFVLPVLQKVLTTSHNISQPVCYTLIWEWGPPVWPGPTTRKWNILHHIAVFQSRGTGEIPQPFQAPHEWNVWVLQGREIRKCHAAGNVRHLSKGDSGSIMLHLPTYIHLSSSITKKILYCPSWTSEVCEVINHTKLWAVCSESITCWLLLLPVRWKKVYVQKRASSCGEKELSVARFVWYLWYVWYVWFDCFCAFLLWFTSSNRSRAALRLWHLRLGDLGCLVKAARVRALLTQEVLKTWWNYIKLPRKPRKCTKVLSKVLFHPMLQTGFANGALCDCCAHDTTRNLGGLVGQLMSLLPSSWASCRNSLWKLHGFWICMGPQKQNIYTPALWHIWWIYWEKRKLTCHGAT